MNWGGCWVAGREKNACLMYNDDTGWMIIQPVGPAEKARVLRGGSWNNNDNNLRAANRNNNNPTNSNNNIGFRCALPSGICFKSQVRLIHG